MRSIALACLSLAAAVSLGACSPDPAPADNAAAAEPADAAPAPVEEGDPVAVIETEKGVIAVRLFPDRAPKTVEQFARLAESGFYYRTTFHMVSDKFIMGGDPFSRDNDPYNDGLGNAGNWLPAEFTPETKVERGAVGMTRKESDPNTASCQFFIAVQRKADWDGKYTVFGQVVEGMDVVEAISKVATVKKDPKLMLRPAGKQIIKGIKIERRKFEEAPAAPAPAA